MNITGTAKNENELSSYELKLIAPNSVEKVLATGVTEVDAGLLATWDTTTVADGIYQLELTAIGVGGTSWHRITVFVKNGEDDLVPPFLEFESPKHEDNVEGEVSIKATITDNRDIAAYELAIKTAYADDFETVATGSGEVNGDEIYLWDTEGLEDGTYLIRLSARDSAGNRSSKTIFVTIGTEDGGGVPFIEFVSPEHGGTVRGNVPIIVNITDQQDITSYELGIKSALDDDFDIVATGNGTVTNGRIY